jgi:peroxiredoxin
MAPALVAPALGGAEFSLSAEKGKITILHFWATWCPACKKEMHALASIYKQFHAQGVDVMGASVDRLRDRDHVVQAMHDFPFPTVLIKEAKNNGFGSLSSIPMTYVVGPDGQVKARFDASQGELTEAKVADLIHSILAKH